MRIALRLLPLLLGIAGVLATPATALELTTKTKAFDVRISGSHVVDWAYTSALDRSNCASWSVGKGQFKATYKIAKKVRYELVEIFRNGRLTETRWGATRDRLPKFAMTQGGDWRSNSAFKMECTPCGPLSEFGPCVPDAPAPPKPSCPKRSARGVVDTTFLADGRDAPTVIENFLAPLVPRAALVAEVRYSEDPKWGSQCYPQAGSGDVLPLAQPAALLVDIGDLPKMQRGARERFDSSRDEYVKSGVFQEGVCGPLEGVLKINACSTTRIELQVKRVR